MSRGWEAVDSGAGGGGIILREDSEAAGGGSTGDRGAHIAAGTGAATGVAEVTVSSVAVEVVVTEERLRTTEPFSLSDVRARSTGRPSSSSSFARTRP